MSVELLYFSELSKICQNLKSRKDRTDIAKPLEHFTGYLPGEIHQ